MRGLGRAFAAQRSLLRGGEIWRVGQWDSGSLTRRLPPPPAWVQVPTPQNVKLTEMLVVRLRTWCQQRMGMYSISPGPRTVSMQWAFLKRGKRS